MNKFFQNIIIILSLVVFIFFFDNKPTYCDTLKFVQLSDVHYTTTRDNTSYKLLASSKPLLEDAINQINCLNGLDFVMITGDLIDNPNEPALRDSVSIVNKLRYPWYFAFGNHDTTTSGNLTKKRFVEVLRETNKCYKFENAFYSFEPKRCYRVIVLDGAKNRGISSNGRITEEQLKFLDNELKAAKNKKEVALIFLHFPLEEPFPSTHHRIINASEMQAVIDKYHFPIAIFTGHYHTTKIIRKDNVLHVSSPSLASYPNAFRLITVRSDRNKVTFTFKYMETSLKDLQTKARIMTLGSSSYYGEETDRDTTVTIDK